MRWFPGVSRLCILCLLAFPAHPGLYAGEDPPEDRGEWFTGDGPPLVEGEGLVFTERREGGLQTRTLGREEIEGFHAPDLASLLEQALDLPVSRYGPYGNAAGINLRGLGTARTAILIDGVPVNSPQSGEFDLAMIDVNAVEGIEVSSGGYGGRYDASGAAGGTINIVTRKRPPAGLRFGGTVSNTAALPGGYYSRQGERESPRAGDLLDTQKISTFTGYGGDGFSWTAGIFANRGGNHFVFQDPYGTSRRRENNEVYDGGASASFVRDFGPAELSFSGDMYYGDKNIPGKVFSAGTGKQKDFSTGQTILLETPRIFRDGLAAGFTLNHRWQTLDYQENGDRSLHQVQTVQGINRWDWQPLPLVKLRAGGDYRFTRLDSTNTGSRTGHDGGVYGGAEYAPHEKLLILPSLKVVFNGTAAVPVPKLALIWYAAGSLTLQNNYFRTFKFPSFNDLHWTGDPSARGNPDLKPEDGLGTDLAAEIRFRDRFTLEAVLFSSYVRDTIHWRTVNGIIQPVNIGEAAFFGADTRLRGTIPLSRGPVKKLTFTLSWQYLQSYILTGDLDFSSNIRMPYVPTHTAGASLLIPWETGSLLVSGRYEGRRYADYTRLTNTGAMDPRFLLNLTLNQRITKNLQTFITLNNLLNQSWYSLQDYPLPGLTVSAGLTLQAGP